MGVVQKWLEGIGLPPPVVANFRAAGIVKPADLLELEVMHYEALGVADPADRRKLFFLVQRLKQAQQAQEEEEEAEAQEEDDTGTASSSGSNSGSNSGSSGNTTDGESSEGGSDKDVNDANGDMPPPPPPTAAPANDDEDAEAVPGISRQPMPSSRRSARSRRTAAAATASATSVLESATAATTATAAAPSASASASASSSGAGRTTRRSARAAAAVRDGASPRNRKKHGGAGVATTDGTGTAINSSPASSVENYDSPNRPVVVPRSKSNAKTKSNAKSSTKNETDNDGIGIGKGITKNKTTAGRTRSRSPVRRTTRSASATTSTSTLEGPATATATNARSRGRTKSPVRTTSASRSTARSRSPVRMTNATKARAAAIRARSPSGSRTRSRSPGRATNSAGASTGRARSRSPPAAGRPRRPVTATKTVTSATAAAAASTRSVASRGTMAVGSPTKTSGTQTSSRRKKAPEVDLAEDIDTESDNDDDVPSRAMSKKGTKSPRRRPATANGGAANASRSNSRRSLLSKQSSLPSLQSRSANLSDEGSVGSKSSAKSSSSAGSKSGRRRSTGTAKSSGNGSAGGASSSRPASASGARGAGKRHSKLPGPSKIPSRVGSLSTIPSERVAIMSPLVRIQLDGGDAVNGSHGLRRGISYDDSDDDDDEDHARFRRRSGSLSSTGSSSGRRRLSAPLARAKSSSNLSSDEDQREGKRVGKRRGTSSIGSGRQSLGGLPRGRRTSSIGLPSKGSVTASNTSGRKASSPLRSQSPESQRADSVVSSKIDLSAELETGTSGFASGTVFVQGMPEDKSWGTQVSRLREEQNRAHEMEFSPEEPRRGDYDEDIDDMRIRVVVRKRPMSRSEAARKDDIDVIHPLEYHSYGKIMVYQPKTRVDLTKEVETIPFAFDNTFDESANNSEIYERTVSGLIPAVFDGQFCNVFAYGQTGSGKTFTMMGSNLTGANAGNQDDSNPGLYYLAAQDVFYLANEPEFQHLTVTASLFEIYSGKLFDLLNGRSPIKCLEDHRGKVCFPGLTEHAITNAGELMQLMKNGAVNRSTGTTSKNADSSRSHAVLQISLKSNRDRKKGIEHGRLTLIDLAGAERGADTSQASRATRLEGAEINTSLLALKEVIRALATGDSMKHIPFRGSKLTQVLKESFVGQNNRTVMVACVAPNMNNCEHTLNTLRYADRVKERDAQTGNIPAAVAEAASSVVNRKKKPTSTPTSILSPYRQVQRPATAPVGSNRSVDSGRSKDSFQEVLDAEDDDKEGSDLYDDHLLLDDDHDDHDDHDAEDRRATSDSFILDRLLGDDTDEEHSTPAIPKPLTNRETAQSLIETHRTVMSEMLHMVKREMTLVNSADADRETMEEYFLELEAAQEKQLGLISNLREALVEYYASRTSN